MRIISLKEIKSILPKVDLMNEIEKGFANYSKGNVVVPPVGELHFDSPPGDVHIKYGYIKNDDVFLIVENLFEVVPKVLQKHGKAKNPWPNVDAASGALLYHYGLTEFSYYTVLFSISRAMGIISQIVLNRALGIPIMRPKSVTTDWLKENL